MQNVFSQIADFGTIPIIHIENPDTALPLVKALIDGGLSAIEVTLRSDSAVESLRRITATYPNMIAGAGTVITPAHADKAKNAGARFVVSPGFDEELVRYCQSISMPILPGCATPSELQKAYAMGIEYVKFFPMDCLGGIKTMKALHAPFPKVKFVPTCGVNFSNLAELLNQPFIAAAGGSFMAPSNLIAEGKWDEITQNAAKCIEIKINGGK